MSQLNEIVLGLGAREGYSGDDLTNLVTAVGRGEVPILRAQGGATGADPVLELRVHGVGGAPPTENLESPAVLQTAGDTDAGFFRAWYPGGNAATRPRIEAYCWGGLNYRWRFSAFWLLLLPFGLANLAQWMLPAATDTKLAKVGRFVLRLHALALTAAFIATTMFLFTDLLAWQAAGRQRLWSWLGWFQAWPPEGRIALATVPVFAVIALLTFLGVRSQGRYEEKQAGLGAPDAPEWPLSTAEFWRGKHRLTQLRHAHLMVAGATVAYLEASPYVDTHNGWRTAIIWGCGFVVAVAVVLVIRPWRVPTTGAHQSLVPEWLGRILGYGSLVGAAAVCLVRADWAPTCIFERHVKDMPDPAYRPRCSDTAIPHDLAVQNVIACVPLGLAVLAFVVVGLQRPWSQRVEGGPPAEKRDVLAKGFAAPFVVLLAGLVSEIFGASMTMSVANLLGTPKVSLGAKAIALGKNDFSVPFIVFAAGLAFAVTLVCALVLVVAALINSHREATRIRVGRAPGSLTHVYQDRGATDALPKADAARTTSQVWANSKLTDHAAVALIGTTAPAMLVFAIDVYLRSSSHRWQWIDTIARVGTTAGVFVTVTFMLFLRSAFSNTANRKRFGFFWDVVTFWPRACHPFGPPSYGERSVPELVTRIRRVVGAESQGAGDPAVAQQRAEQWGGADLAGLIEAHSKVLLVGYSQGAPIATAAVAQLSKDAADRIALLTLASPVRRLYGRAFPAYFGTQQLEELRTHLTTEDTESVRWLNVLRRSDYIGGWVIRDPDDVAEQGESAEQVRTVNREIYDPPVLWTDDDPSPPPTHEHSDWFSDPQTRQYAEQLRRQLMGRSARRGPDAGRPLVTTAWVPKEWGERVAFDAEHGYYVLGAEDAPRVLLLHEFPGIEAGLYPFVTRLAEKYRVFVPSIFGRDGSPAALNTVRQICVRREIRMLISGSPALSWLRHLLDDVVTPKGVDDARVGVIGMCMTGNFALALAVEPQVKAAVLAQPAWPPRPSSLGLSGNDRTALKARKDLCIRGLRFKDDRLSPAAKLESVEALFAGLTLPPDAIVVDPFLTPPEHGHHSTLTGVSANETAISEVLAFLDERLRPPAG